MTKSRTGTKTEIDREPGSNADRESETIAEKESDRQTD